MVVIHLCFFLTGCLPSTNWCRISGFRNHPQYVSSFVPRHQHRVLQSNTNGCTPNHLLITSLVRYCHWVKYKFPTVKSLCCVGETPNSRVQSPIVFKVTVLLGKIPEKEIPHKITIISVGITPEI